LGTELAETLSTPPAAPERQPASTVAVTTPIASIRLDPRIRRLVRPVMVIRTLL
jgi:hypothetical protein